MDKQKSKTDLIFDALKNETNELNLRTTKEKKVKFSNLDIDSIKPKGNTIEYASVKLKTELYERVKDVALQNGVKQPGKFISLILEAYLKQIE